MKLTPQERFERDSLEYLMELRSNQKAAREEADKAEGERDLRTLRHLMKKYPEEVIRIMEED